MLERAAASEEAAARPELIPDCTPASMDETAAAFAVEATLRAELKASVQDECSAEYSAERED